MNIENLPEPDKTDVMLALNLFSATHHNVADVNVTAVGRRHISIRYRIPRLRARGLLLVQRHSWSEGATLTQRSIRRTTGVTGATTDVVDLTNAIPDRRT